MNVQFAIQTHDGESTVYVLEVNPRASRTVPFVSKATGKPLAKIGALVMVGITLEQQGETREIVPPYYSIKESVFPFTKFPGVDPLLGPEMRSTGEVMGVGETFGEALFKSQLGAGSTLPESGTVFLSVMDRDKPKAIAVARLPRQRLSVGGNARNRAGDRSGRNSGCDGQQGQGWTAARGRFAEKWRHSTSHHYRERGAQPDRRLAFDPHHRAGAARYLLHDDGRRTRSY